MNALGSEQIFTPSFAPQTHTVPLRGRAQVSGDRVLPLTQVLIVGLVYLNMIRKR